MRRSSINGAKLLKRRLNRLPKEVKAVLKPAIEKAAIEIQKEAARRVPIDSGDLKASLHHKVMQGGKFAKIGWWKKANLRKWRLGGWRSHFVEVGSRGGTIKTGRNKGVVIPPQAARPMLMPALRARKKATIKIIDDAVTRVLRRSSRGG